MGKECLTEEQHETLDALVKKGVAGLDKNDPQRKEFEKLSKQVKVCSTTKRPPSAYNVFMGRCMKEKGQNMSSCAATYREEKEKNKK